MKIKGVTRVRVTKVEKKTDTRSMVYFKSTRKNKDEQFVDSLFIGTFVANANNKIGDLTSVLDKLEKWDNGQAKQGVVIFLTEFEITKELYVNPKGEKTYPLNVVVFNWEYTVNSQAPAPVAEDEAPLMPDDNIPF